MEEDRDNAGTNDETLQESAPDSVGFLFFNSQGKTYMRRKHKEPQRLFNFTLSKAGILKSHRVSGEGKYIYILRSKVHDDFVLRYFEWLETEYDEKPHQIFHETSYIGYQQKDNVWVLSNQLQIKNNRVLPEIEWTNMVLGEELYECYVTFNERLLDMEYLTSVFKNEFVLGGVVNKDHKGCWFGLSNNTFSLDESKYCCLYSAAKGLGKTKTLELIASGEGVGDRSEHSFMIGGGNGGQVGMTSKMQQDVYCQTNMIVILNEISMKSKIIAETLNQSRDGFGMGSLSTGRKASRATIMGSSNELIHQSLDGRMMMIHYYECKHTNEMEKVLNERLDPLFDQNKGCILAWCMRHQDFWEYVKTDIRYRLHSVIERVLPKKQRRYRWALTGNVLVLYMMFITSKVRCESVSAFEAIVKAENSPKEDVFTWVNPCCSFTDEDGHSVEAIAISATKFNRFSDVSPLELTPESRKRYTALSPHSRAAFTLGFECAKKRRLIFEEDPDNRASGGATKSDGSD